MKIVCRQKVFDLKGVAAKKKVENHWSSFLFHIYLYKFKEQITERLTRGKVRNTSQLIWFRQIRENH